MDCLLGILSVNEFLLLVSCKCLQSYLGNLTDEKEFNQQKRVASTVGGSQSTFGTRLLPPGETRGKQGKPVETRFHGLPTPEKAG